LKLTSLARVGASELFGPDEERVTVGASELFGEEISEEEANRTLTPEEQAKVVPQFGAGTERRMSEYRGLSPEAASAKYRQGWADTFSNIYDTATDPRKLASAAGSVAKTGYNAVRHPIETAEKVGSHYYENPDLAFTDAAFAMFPGRQGVQVLEKAVSRKVPDSMPRGSVRDQAELVGTGGGRMNASKKSEAVVPPEEILPAFSGFHTRLGEKGIRINKKLHPKTWDAFQDFTNFVRPKPMQENVRPATVLDLHEVRQQAAIAAKDRHPDGKATADSMLANELIKTIDEVIAKHPEGDDFLMGKSELARGLKSEGLLNLVEQAKNTTQWDRGDHAGAIRNKINSYIKTNKRFLTKKDIKELRHIKRFGFAEALGGQGSLSPMAMAIGRVVESVTGIPPGGLYVAGKLARETVNTSKIKELENMAARIRAGE
jgi:hypothetical protein